MGAKFSKQARPDGAAEGTPPAAADAPAASAPASEAAASAPVSPLPVGAAPRKRRVSVSAEVDKSKEPVEKRVVPKAEDVIQQITASVKTNFLFNALQPEQLQEVVDAMEERNYAAGDTIIKEGDDGDNFYVVAEGECDVFIDGKNGGAAVRTLKQGAAFGELALMYNAPRSATIKVQEGGGAVKCWALDRGTFRRTIMAAGHARRKKYEKFLNQLELLSHLMPPEIAQLADAVEPLSFEAGEVVIAQGDADRPSFKFYIIEEGEAQAFVRGKEGEDVLMSKLGVGQYFGEKALVEMTPRTATVKAHTALKCACLSIAAFERLMGPCEDLLRERAKYNDVDDVQSGRVTPKEAQSPLRGGEATESA